MKTKSVYLLRKRPNGEVIVRCDSFQEALMTKAMFEAHAAEFENHESEVYYINEAIEW